MKHTIFLSCSREHPHFYENDEEYTYIPIPSLAIKDEKKITKCSKIWIERVEKIRRLFLKFPTLHPKIYDIFLPNYNYIL